MKINKALYSIILSALLLTSCENVVVAPTPTPPPAPVVPAPKVEVPTFNGIAMWNDFEQVAKDAGGNYTVGINNIKNVHGFSGWAKYSEVKKLVTSNQYIALNRHFDTKNLKIYFDYINSDDGGDVMTPAVIDELFNMITHINITPINNANNSLNYVKVYGSFDVNRYHHWLSNGFLNVEGITTTPTNQPFDIGVSDPYLGGKLTTTMEKLKYIAEHNIFKTAKVDNVILTGNIKGANDFYVREKTATTSIKYDAKDSFYKSDDGMIDTLSILELEDFQARGGGKNFDGVLVKSFGTAPTTLNLNNTKLKDVEFFVDTDLKALTFDYVESQGTLKIAGILPKSMRYLNAETLDISRAEVPLFIKGNPALPVPTVDVGGCEITGMMVKELSATNLINPTSFTSKRNGTIEHFKGDMDAFNGLKVKATILKQTIYNVIVKVMNIFNGKTHS